MSKQESHPYMSLCCNVIIASFDKLLTAYSNLADCKLGVHTTCNSCPCIADMSSLTLKLGKPKLDDMSEDIEGSLTCPSGTA